MCSDISRENETVILIVSMLYIQINIFSDETFSWVLPVISNEADEYSDMSMLDNSTKPLNSNMAKSFVNIYNQH